MAKNKPKANSRAARRAESPSLNVDRSLTTVPRAESPTAEHPSVLTDRRNSGIQKKQKGKKLSRAQRLRQQKGMDRAEAVMDQLEIKKAKSFVRAKAVDARRGDWEDLNRKAAALLAAQQAQAKAKAEAEAEAEVKEVHDRDGDEDMDGDTTPFVGAVNPFESQPTNAASNPVTETPMLADEDDDIT
ncbi:Ribosome biogenesis protein Alb1 [Penicillium taxi]|uniref:Ribosome biogenesis protein Alb1 n=1 Tax=Penicillium taxi TaxID=168475 RepID=UPI0025455EC2|nr:Ribosome biogenesis protein Alb1 [Penicillium taxi]KAJ5894241.1 Ribosome biogenesis protein Alb1 [Penicillium taxi]